MMGMKMSVEDEEEEDYGNKEVYDLVSWAAKRPEVLS